MKNKDTNKDTKQKQRWEFFMHAIPNIMGGEFRVVERHYIEDRVKAYLKACDLGELHSGGTGFHTWDVQGTLTRRPTEEDIEGLLAMLEREDLLKAVGTIEIEIFDEESGEFAEDTREVLYMAESVRARGGVMCEYE